MSGRFTVNASGHTVWQAGAAESKPAGNTQSCDEKINGGTELYTGELSRDDVVPRKPIAAMSYGQRVRISRLWSSHEEFIGKTIRLAGWAKSTRMGGSSFCFVELNDGSCFKNIQVVVDEAVAGFKEVSKAITGASFMFKGTLIESPAKGQPFELQVKIAELHTAQVLGNSDGTYPLQGRPTLETLRTQAHLRPRTNTIGAVARVRNNLAYATHQFFQSRGFLYVHTPIVTASDCEGAGEMFAVTTTLPGKDDPITKAKLLEATKTPKSAEEIAVIEAAKKAEEEKATEGMDPAKKAKLEKKKAAQLKKAGGEEKKDEDLYNFTPIPLEQRPIDYKKDMFGKPAFLTVSGQLNVETYAVALSDCYTFGPTFRAENSNTTRHLCEFWMIEPEITFATLQDDMDCAEDYVRFCLKYVMLNNADDLDFFNFSFEKGKKVETGLLKRLQNMIDKPFERLSYTRACEILESDLKSKKVKFENKVFWGCDLASEHEKYLTDKVFCGPVIVYDYPADLKAFYMKQNEDGKTVQAMDVLVPEIGELIGGSAREDDIGKLDARIDVLGLSKEDYWWYRDLRKYGSVPHAGFGLGFERLVRLATGIENIRDVIPFPRAPGQAEF